MIDFKDWTSATANLPAGVQRTFLDVLGLAAEGKIKLNWGTDNWGGGACLVNQARNMLAGTQSGETPTQAFNAVVRAFDLANSELFGEGVNTDSRIVSPLAAETLIRNFGPLKPLVIEVDSNPVKPAKYVEPSDDALMTDWLNSLKETPADDTTPVVSSPEGEVIQGSTPFTG